MRRRIWRFIAPVALALASGCATRGYVADRLNDAADVATLTVGIGAGLKARVGPVQVALIENSDIAGLRAGMFFWDGLDLFMNEELYVLPFPMKGVRSSDWSLPYGLEAFSHGPDSLAAARGKDVTAQSPLPCIVIGRDAPFYTQVELAAGLGPMVRLGVNPGELLDFLLGLFMIDLYSDDIGTSRRRLPPLEKGRKP